MNYHSQCASAVNAFTGKLTRAMLLITAVCVTAGAGEKKTIDDVLNALGRSHSAMCAVICPAEIPVETVQRLAGSGYNVHVIASDAQSRDRFAAVVAGDPKIAYRVMVEALPVNKLPYRDNLVNLVVVETKRAAFRQGLAREEIERVTVPGGVIAYHEKNTWEIVKKTWPADMDDWTHPNKDATGNRVSHDAHIQLPVGYKWIDGVISGERSTGWVSTQGRLFTLGSIEPENYVLCGEAPSQSTDFLTARDAFNGLVLWKQAIGTPRPRTSGVRWSMGRSGSTPPRSTS